MTYPEIVWAALAVAAAYVLGSIPVGVIVCRVGYGIDILQHGSRRSGATNVYRTVGLRAAAIVFAGDFLKGLVPTLIARLVFGEYQLVSALVACATTVGHNWSMFVRFRGGRGVTTSWGAVMALAPIAAVIGVPIGLATLYVGRYVSLSSLVGAVGFLAAAAIFYVLDLGVSGTYVALIAGFVVFLFSQHLDNVQRLFAGTERRLAPWPDIKAGRGSRGRGG